MLNGATGLIAAAAREVEVSTICPQREMAEAGCVMSYCPPLREGLESVAKQLDRALREANPADPPVEQPPLFKLIINKSAASAVGLILSLALLVHTDEVIE
jgi:putative ABC transport system substrate-binding protein